MKELYSIDLPVTVRSNGAMYPMVLRVPGWANIGVLRARAVPMAIPKRRA